jgi:predicted ArsR family transcriptional regulator
VTDVAAPSSSTVEHHVSGRAHGPPVATGSALASESRRTLLRLLRSAEEPQDAHELAAATGLHVSTVRFHLDVLRDAGLVMGRPKPRASAGRPRTVYSPLTRALPDGSSTLLRLLAARLGDTPRARSRRAERAGIDWAAELTVGLERPDEMGQREAAHLVTGLFAELGFDPELTGDEQSQVLRLRDCPFRDTARASPDVVCAVHLGLLRGILTQLGARSTTARLVPFVQPELCLAHLAPARARVRGR